MANNSSVNVKIELGGVDSAKRGLKDVADNFKEAGDAGKKFKDDTRSLEEVGDSFKKIGKQFTKFVTVPIVTGITGLGKMFGNLEYEIARVSTLTSDAFDISGFTQDVLNQSKITGVDTTQLTKNVYTALTASIPEDYVMDFVYDAHVLATAGFTDEATAIDVLTTAINAYGFEADDATRLSDLLIGTQDRGKTTVDELGKSLGDVIPIAADNGLSFEQLSASMALLTRNGIGTARASTYTRSMLQELGKTGSTSDKALRELSGKGFRGLMEEGYNLSDVLQMLDGYATDNGLTLQDMFGNIRAGTGAMALMSGEGDDLAELIDFMGDVTGRTDENFEEMSETMNYRTRVAFNRIKTAGYELALNLAPVWETVADTMDTVAGKVEDLVEWFIGLSDSGRNAVGMVTLFLIAIGPVMSVIGNLLIGWAKFGGVVIKGIKLIVGALGILFKFALAHPFVALVAVIIGVIAVIYANWDKVGPYFQMVWDKIVEVFNIGLEWIVDKWNSAWTAVKDFIQPIWASITESVTGAMDTVSEGITSALEWITETWTSVWTSITEFVTPIWEGIKEVVSIGMNFIWEVIKNTLYVIVGITYFLWMAVFDVIKAVWDFIGPFVLGAITVVADIVVFFWEFIRDTTVGIWELIKETLSVVWQAITEIFTWALEVITEFVVWAWEGIVELTTTVWNYISELFVTIWEGIKSLFNTVLEFLKNLIKVTWEFIKSTTQAVWDGIIAVISAVWGVIGETVMTAINGVLTTIRTIWNTVKEVTSTIWDAVWGTIKEIANNIWTSIKEIFNNMLESIKKIFGKVVTAVSDKMTETWETVTGFYTKFRDAGENIVTNIRDGILGTWHKVTNAVSEGFEKVRNLIPFSPPKDKSSPLVGLEKNGIAGNLADGIMAGEGEVDMAMRHVLQNDLASQYQKKSTVSREAQTASNQEALRQVKQPAYINLKVGDRTLRAFVEDISNIQAGDIGFEESYGI